MFLTELNDGNKRHIAAWVARMETARYISPTRLNNGKYQVNGEISMSMENRIDTDQRFVVLRFNDRYHAHYDADQPLDDLFTAIDGLLGGYIPTHVVKLNPTVLGNGRT